MKRPIFWDMFEESLDSNRFPNGQMWLTSTIFLVNLRRLKSGNISRIDQRDVEHFVWWDELMFKAGFPNRKPNRSSKKYLRQARHRYKANINRLVRNGEIQREPELDCDGFMAYRKLPTVEASLFNGVPPGEHSTGASSTSTDVHLEPTVTFNLRYVFEGTTGESPPRTLYLFEDELNRIWYTENWCNFYQTECHLTAFLNEHSNQVSPEGSNEPCNQVITENPVESECSIDVCDDTRLEVPRYNSLEHTSPVAVSTGPPIHNECNKLPISSFVANNGQNDLGAKNTNALIHNESKLLSDSSFVENCCQDNSGANGTSPLIRNESELLSVSSFVANSDQNNSGAESANPPIDNESNLLSVAKMNCISAAVANSTTAGSTGDKLTAEIDEIYSKLNSPLIHNESNFPSNSTSNENYCLSASVAGPPIDEEMIVENDEMPAELNDSPIHERNMPSVSSFDENNCLSLSVAASTNPDTIHIDDQLMAEIDEIWAAQRGQYTQEHGCPIADTNHSLSSKHQESHTKLDVIPEYWDGLHYDCVRSDPDYESLWDEMFEMTV